VVKELKAKELADSELEADLQKKDAFEELKQLAQGAAGVEKVEHIHSNGAPPVIMVRLKLFVKIVKLVNGEDSEGYIRIWRVDKERLTARDVYTCSCDVGEITQSKHLFALRIARFRTTKFGVTISDRSCWFYL
jgi:hypothetical protein